MRGRGSAVLALALAALAAVAAAPRPAAAQAGYTAEVWVRGNRIDVRGLERDSVPESEIAGEGPVRRLEDGTLATCVPGAFCAWYGSGAVERATLLTQDLRISAWPGVRGLAVHAHLRGRYGSDGFWPRSDQELEALHAYVHWERGDVRVRAGRQYRTNGLGYANFDGASVLWRGFDAVRIDAYGGWSLARNLNAPRTGSLLQSADEFAPDDRGLLVGVDVTGGFGQVARAALTYQREIRTDERALYTERVSADVGARWRTISLDLAADYDLAFEEFNEASARVSAPLPAGFEGSAQLRRYAPHFELWTIWGAFSPVGYDEARAWLAWQKGDWRLEGGAARREYEETVAGADFVRFEESGTRGFGRVHWGRRGWYADAGYSAAEGSGAARYGGDVSVGHDFGDETYVSARATSSQSFSEFRVGEQGTYGFGVDGAYKWRDLVLTGTWARYDVTHEDRPRQDDWVQHRLHLGVKYRFGNEPGSEAAP